MQNYEENQREPLGVKSLESPKLGMPFHIEVNAKIKIANKLEKKK